MIFDLVGVDKRYVDDDDFVASRVVDVPYQTNAADEQILQDKGHYRVLDLSGSPLNSARASYFHQSLGGYHGAKPKRMQDLFDFYIYKGNQGVLNMLNVRYNIVNNDGNLFPQRNPYANGPAWFVNELQIVQNDNEAILALENLDTKNVAIIEDVFASEVSSTTFEPESTATIQLKSYQPNELRYSSNTLSNQFAVFSEMYYEKGWNAYIDGTKSEILRVDYTLRGLEIPAGDHEVIFKFEPNVIKTGSTIVLGSSILLILMLLGGLFYEFRKRKSVN